MILQWLPKAIANRDAQIAYIAQDNPLATITQGDLIKTQVEQLIEQPAWVALDANGARVSW